MINFKSFSCAVQKIILILQHKANNNISQYNNFNRLKYIKNIVYYV